MKFTSIMRVAALAGATGPALLAVRTFAFA